MQSIGSHLSIQDHEIALQQVIDNPLSIGEVATINGISKMVCFEKDCILML